MNESDVLINDTNIKEYGLRLRPEHEHPSPETSETTIDIPGQIGALPVKSTTGVRTFSLPLGVIPQENKYQLQRKIRAFTNVLFNEFGRTKKVKLQFGYEPDKFYMVKLNSTISPERLVKLGMFDLSFVAHDSRAYSNAKNTEITWGSKIITFEYDYLLGHKTHTDVDITNPQTLIYTVQGLAIKPTIEISGSADSLSINTSNYAINLPSFYSEHWVIDCQKYIVSRNGSNAFNDVKLREFQLMPGENPIEITGSNIDVSMRLTYRDKWM
ncbi:distal tail protein Dit [Lentibacillus amyloliquefaciens]|uniref:Phage tail protein n=1 Tax=Lentibacillus amyloliquefaciens TaxID=1472767 RepID=A0A0U4F4P3_9BACI|nr:distal tail protein Dit [Lentibacillus amyloliquefaciens]ALX50471.1 hypothetical protein AOX59_18920 [Lentibacillus amyloliquefaciens]